MRLTKLEINGFKSFAKKTEILIEPGITAIIGPNGCGKSNIADAVRWVLGEQSARVLRGNRMEDIIFNGTEARKPQSFCEVTLTFDNTDGRLPTDYSEVSVTRRVYRSGESEYLLNRTACRLKDINELFRDTGIGREGYSIIGQGKVEEILSNKSNDRRNAFEEAAGVMKYRVRKEEAERKLDGTRKNIVRLDDILEELGKQVGPLEEQSAAAREFLKLRDELKEIEVNVFLYQYDKLTERIATLTVAMEEFSGQIQKSAVLEAALASDCTAEEENERRLSAAIGDVQAKLLAASSGYEAKSGEAKVMQEKLANIARERERLEAQLSETSQRHEELKRQLAEAASTANENRSRREAASAELEAAEAARIKLEGSIETMEEDLENQKNSMIEAMNRLSDAKSRISRLEAIKTTIIDRMGEVRARQSDAEAEGEKLTSEYDGANAILNSIKERRDAQNTKRAEAISHLNELNSGIRQAREEVRQMEQRIEAANSRVKVLQEMKRAYEGYYASVRNLLRDAQRDVSLSKKIEGVVAELVRVPAEYESAIEMALGSSLQNIVTPTEQDAKQVIEYLRQKQYGRATLLPISAMRPRLLSAEERSMCAVDGFIGVASELIKSEDRYRGIVENLLGRTIIVRDLDAGIAINKRAHSAFRIATVKGDIINPGGSMTGGSLQKREFSLIGREREIETLTQDAKKQAELLLKKQDEAAALEQELEKATASMESFSEGLHALDVELATQHEKVEIIQKYVDDNAADVERIVLEYSQMQDNIDNIDEQCREADADRDQWEQGNVTSQDDIKRMQGELTALRTEHAAAVENATDRKVTLMALEKELSAVENEARRIARESEAAAAAMDSDRNKIDEDAKLFVTLQQSMGSIDATISDGRKDVDALTDQLRLMEEERAKHIRALDELRERRDKMNIDMTDARERTHKTELNLNRAQMELQNMQDRIWNDYELTYENAQPLRRQIAVTASHVRIDELKAAIRELGDINISSIEDYKNVKERFDTLSAQYQDLTKAEEDLKQLITELVSTMEDEFSKQFALIQANFSAVFAELFGGGRAELVLSDKNDILNCDIDIIAQPPGKKLQLLSLLSGGERSLTAIALVFAILKLKPTAFCILDEIESALDEANVTNFAEYVRNYSDNTQFILITHRRGSMAVCNTLYGVAMEEKGVSKVVSAKFGESESA